MKLFVTIYVFVINVALSTCKSTRPNIILILTDDQDVLLNSMIPMTNARNLIANQGVTFQNSFVNTPICCPSRSTILTGKYLHNTGVRNNSISGNCSSLEWQKYHEPFTFTSILKNSANYTTFYAGKYLNQYGSKDCGGTEHAPVGYDWWIGLKGNSRYYNYTLSINGTAQEFSDQYLTDVMKSYALSFLNQNHVKETPFFMMLSTPAAHAPFTPAPRHKNAFPEIKATRAPSFNYSADDKHWLLTMPPKALPADVTILDDIQRHRFQTLLAVDEMVYEIVSKLKVMNLLDNTYLIFTSDNGYHIGQFVQPWDKRQPYETDIRVPLLIRGPNVKHNYTCTFPVSSVDLAPTILYMAGIPVPDDMDGVSFLSNILIDNKEQSAQDRNILIEYFGEGDKKSIDENCPWVYDGNVTECTVESWCKCQDSRNNTYNCIRRFASKTDFKFCKFHDNNNFVEAYDLQNDPYELKNIFHNMDSFEVEDYRTTLNAMRYCAGIQCLNIKYKGTRNLGYQSCNCSSNILIILSVMFCIFILNDL